MLQDNTFPKYIAKEINLKLDWADRAGNCLKIHLKPLTNKSDDLIDTELTIIDICQKNGGQINLNTNQTLTLDPAITNSQIVFSADGGPSSSGNIILTVNGSQKTINVTPAGFISIQ